MQFKWIFVDEVSMRQEKLYKFLLIIKKLKSGDKNQLESVANRIEREYK
jgi:hypothetical protein